MSDLGQRIANLSPEQRAILEQRLMKNGAYTGREQEIIPRDVNGPCPLSFSQQRLWFLNQMEPESAEYIMPRAIRLTGTLDDWALRKAINTIVVRHEVLRTNFVSIDGIPMQVIAKDRSLDLAVKDLSEWPDIERKAKLSSLIAENSIRPFNLSKDLMLRATLFRLAPLDHVLLLVTHHIASDGWSTGVLFREIVALYDAFSTGNSSPLPELPIQYADFAQWQRQRLRGELLKSQTSYWKRQLGINPTVFQLPTDRSRPAVPTHRGSRQFLKLPKPMLDSLQTLSRQEEVTLFMTLLAAFKVLLHRYSGQDRIIVGSPVAGRTRTETEGLLGFFVNNLVLSTDLSGNPTFRELLGRVRKVAL